MTLQFTLSDAKARLSELVREVRIRREAAIITVDGQPAVRVIPVETGPRRLTAAEIAAVRALIAGLARIERPNAPFDAVDLVAEGRR